ncbi:hypothetical protein E2562_006308 [Oryza meyeriana var. granulata]|uniref:Uncharacterized protein n=1 Tax=Oryza meyeriana var. granulata TaxID=110450 RepID=A0A6G1EG59_9ORYZ|nr:hypothetical protein E2562_006308 [Oryza meyeriana var. granulata]
MPARHRFRRRRRPHPVPLPVHRRLPLLPLGRRLSCLPATPTPPFIADSQGRHIDAGHRCHLHHRLGLLLRLPCAPPLFCSSPAHRATALLRFQVAAAVACSPTDGLCVVNLVVDLCASCRRLPSPCCSHVVVCRR